MVREKTIPYFWRLPVLIMACASVLVLAGCFSMSAVPPASGLLQADKPNGHDAVRFNTAAGIEVESYWGKDRKFILLHPLINGRDVGWFIFDTGASGCTITADAAAKAGLPPVGSTRLQGQTRTTVFRCDTLRVGALELEGLNMTGLNMSRSSGAFGRTVVGILGRNVCSSAIIEIDGPSRVVRLHAPRTATGIDAPIWVPIEMYKQLPQVRCGYAGMGEGSFVIDTGADATVHFLGSAVESHNLMKSKGVKITGGKTQITLGSIGRIKEGTVDDFRIGEQQCGPVVATFANPGDLPSQTLPDVHGLIGMGLMKKFTVYLDEPGGKVAFVDSPQKGK